MTPAKTKQEQGEVGPKVPCNPKHSVVLWEQGCEVRHREPGSASTQQRDLCTSGPMIALQMDKINSCCWERTGWRME